MKNNQNKNNAQYQHHHKSKTAYQIDQMNTEEEYREFEKNLKLKEVELRVKKIDEKNEEISKIYIEKIQKL